MTQRSNSRGVRFWIVSAWLPEQQFLRDTFAGKLSDQLKKADLVECGEIGFLCTGVGSVRAAARVANALAPRGTTNARPEAVLFLGTAGCYSENVELNSAHFCSEVAWSDGDLSQARSYLPDLENGCVRCHSQPSVFQFDELSAVSTPGITTDAHLAQCLARFGQLENLELYGVAEAARILDVRWGAVLGVSNRVGLHSHKEWKANHLEASLSAQQKLLDQFLKGQME